MHTQPGREIGGQLPPLAASLRDIQQSIHDAAKFILAWTASGMAAAPRRLQQRFQPAPLCGPSNRSDTCPQATKHSDPCIFLPWFLQQFLDRFLQFPVSFEHEMRIANHN